MEGVRLPMIQDAEHRNKRIRLPSISELQHPVTAGFAATPHAHSPQAHGPHAPAGKGPRTNANGAGATTASGAAAAPAGSTGAGAGSWSAAPSAGAISAAAAHAGLRREAECIQENASYVYHFARKHLPHGATSAFSPMTPTPPPPPPNAPASFDEAIFRAEEILRALSVWRDTVHAEQRVRYVTPCTPQAPPSARAIFEADLEEQLKYKKRSVSPVPPRGNTNLVASSRPRALPFVQY